MSNSSTKYLLDTSVLIEASKRYYAFDLAPTFWQHLTVQSQVGTISSIDKVKVEIDKRNKFLINWANNKFKRWESTVTEDTKQNYLKLIQWSVSNQRYSQNAKDQFANADKADAWLVAHALARRYIVVTEEVFNKDIKNNIRIPNICLEFDVQYIDTFQMMRKLGLVLSQIAHVPNAGSN